MRHFLMNQACRAATACFAASAFGATAEAQSSPPATPANPNSSTIIVTAQNTVTTPENVPLVTQYSESTITSETLRNLSDTQSLQTMLNTQPSVFAYQNGPNGVGANIFFRAFNSGQFAETFGGVAINDLFNGGVTGEAATFNSVLFIPANVDSVVLTRGINNPSTNSYNSLGGTIDFVPRMPTEAMGASAGGSYGSFNSYTVQGAINTGDWHGIKQTVQVDYRKSDGWQPNTANNNLNVYYAGRHDAANGNTLSLVAVFDQNRGHDPFDMAVPLLQTNGGFYQYPSNIANEYGKDTQYMVILDYAAVVTPNVAFDQKFFTGGQNFLRTSYAAPSDANSPYELPNQAEGYDYWIYNPNGPTYNPQTLFGPKVNGVFPGNAYHFYGYTTFAVGYQPKLTITLPMDTMTVGGNFTYGTLHSREFWYGSAPVPQTLGYNNAWDEHDQRLFASAYYQDEIRLLHNTLTITPGVKYILASTRDSDAVGFFYPYGGAVSDTEHFVAPTVGVNFKPTDHVSFNFAFGENIKFPDITAYYNDVPGTTGSVPLRPAAIKIKPEHVNDYELGARYADGEFSLAADVYREDFSNVFIDKFDPDTYSTQVSNGGNARYQGVEVQFSDGVKFEHAGELKGFVNFAYNDAKYTSTFSADALGNSISDTDQTVTAGERVPDVPDYLLTLGGTYAYAGFRLDAQGRYIGSQAIVDRDNGAPANFPGIASDIASYWVVDLGLSKTLALGGGQRSPSVKVSIRVDNLLDKYYFNEAYVQSNGDFAGPTEFAAPAAPRSVTGKIEVSF